MGKRADGWDNGADSQPVYTNYWVYKRSSRSNISMPTHSEIKTHWCMQSHAGPWMHRALRKRSGLSGWWNCFWPSSLMIHCPLSKWTPPSSIDHSPLLFHFFVALVISHLVTSPLICITQLMVSVVVDGTINQWPHLAIITTETNWAHTPRPWKPQMSSFEMIHTSDDMHSRCPLAEVYNLQVCGESVREFMNYGLQRQ